MKRTVVTALLSACLLTLGACGGVNPPTTGNQAGDPQSPVQPPVQPQPQNPVLVNPACTMAYPSTDLTACEEADGTPMTIHPVEVAIYALTNELRTQGTLDGKTTDAAGVNIYDGVCKEGLYARDHKGGLDKLLPEAHVQYAARKHSAYLAHNEIPSGTGITHAEDPQKPFFYHINGSSRLNKAGVPVARVAYYPEENVISGKIQMNTHDTAFYFVLSSLKSKLHCEAMMTNKPGYIGVGYVKSAASYEAITSNFFFSY